MLRARKFVLNITCSGCLLIGRMCLLISSLHLLIISLHLLISSLHLLIGTLHLLINSICIVAPCKHDCKIQMRWGLGTCNWHHIGPGILEVEVLLDKYECLDWVGLEFSASERDSVSFT